MAAGGFVTRAFEAMLKECAGKKFQALQHTIRMYLESAKEGKPPASAGNTNQAAVLSGDGRSDEAASGVDQGGPEMDGSGPSKSNEVGDHGKKSTTIKTAFANAGYTLEGPEVELVLIPLRLAFETKNLKILELALDCLHKLIAYDHLEGDPGLDGGEGSPLLTDMLNMVCCCVDNSSPDSTIIQVLKVLLTAVSSAKFRVHGEPLLGVIKVCYNIALHSKNPINQATSKAMLTQMISIVFRRMEADQVSPSSGSHDQSDAALTENSGLNISADDHGDKKMMKGDPNLVKDNTSFASVEQLNNLAGRADIKGLEAALDKVVHFEDGKKITRELGLDSLSTGKRDALLVFQMLCKICIREDNDEVANKCQILSLELLQGLLDGVEDSFAKDFHFIYSVKAYLSHTLLRASISQSPVIFEYATGTFGVVVSRFRERLKGEIGILFPLIVLRSLDGSGIPTDKKMNVIRMLEKVCKDSQMLVDFYINYDCNPEAPNLFERLITILTKVAQGTQNADPNSSAFSQTSSIKDLSLQFIVNVLKLLVEWEKCHRQRSEMMTNRKCAKEEEVIESEEKESREDICSDFEKEKDHKPTLEVATSECNRRPVKGIDYLISNKLVDGNPDSVAKYLRNTPGLDRAVIGDYLGQVDGFPTAVMHAYVDSMSFSGMKFDSAIREFLKHFQLPREAQKIDRIMEKFAERYCADNPGLFKNPDTAYVLAYAVIMLNIDAHSHMGWPKMSKTDFIQMNAMNDMPETIPTEILTEIYDSVVKEEIKIAAGIGKNRRQKPDGEDRVDLISILNLTLPRRMSSINAKSESDSIIKLTQAMIWNQRAKKEVLYTSQQTELARLMVEAVGWRLLATFSVIMEEGEHKLRFALCLEGFKAGIHITHVLRMDTMRCAFLTSLVRFTFLHAPKEIRDKNVEALQTLLSLGESEPEALKDTWNAVLECVSRLEFIVSTPAIAATIMNGSTQISRDVVIKSLKELARKPAEQVFLNTEKLPSDSIVEFFAALSHVSAEELKQMPPRVFSLQKIVEISYYNMPRIRMVWARIWSVLSDHFISAGSHPDEKIVIYTIDSLRQMGMKYLERPELANFTFQNDILKPFVVLVRNSRSPTIRSLTVDCIVQMIKSKVENIKSGWCSVFMIFTAAADDELESIVESAFENVEQVILEHFDQIARDCFLDCVNCLIRFSNNRSSQRISLKAIALFRICENRLAEGVITGGALKPIHVETETALNLAQHYWFPMLAGLSDLTSDPRAEVSSCALELLFDLLNERGSKFSSSFWERIFHGVLFPIFDHIRHSGVNPIASGDEWLRESCIHSLRLLCDLFNTFYKGVCFMLPQLLSLLLDCAKKTDQTVVSISLGALGHLIEMGGQQFSETDWDLLLKRIIDASYTTQPLELLNDLGFENLKNQSTIVAVSDVHTGGEEDIHQSDESNYGNIPQMTPPSINADRKSNPDETEGKAEKPPKAENLQRSQTFGQRIMDNVRDNLLVKSFTFKPKNHESEMLAPPPPPKPYENGEFDTKDEAESPLMGTVRGKCITQLLLLCAIDGIQKKYWSNLKAPQKIAIMDTLLSLLEFAASYNAYSNLRKRMHHIPAERPPPNLLRQELAGTSIYLEILQKTILEFLGNKERHSEFDVSHDMGICSENSDSSFSKHSDSSEGLEGIAEEKLVSFCEKVLKDTSDLHAHFGESSMDIHKALELRSPVVVKVLKGMCSMNHKIFKKHLREFYPLLTKLVCCEQMDIRGALGELFRAQLKPLLP